MVLLCDFLKGEKSGDAVELNGKEDDVDGFPDSFKGILLEFVRRGILTFSFHILLLFDFNQLKSLIGK